jgi:hypothetical protein
VLPDAVVTMFRDGLDRGGLEFLKHGPRTPAERLAFSQRVPLDAHLDAAPADEAEQTRFRQSGKFDGARYFVGSDRNLYQRTGAIEEPLAARLRRGFETAVGGFSTQSVEEPLADLAAIHGAEGITVLAGGTAADVLDEQDQTAVNYDPATLEKISDVHAANSPPSEYDVLAREFLRAQRVNPTAWRLAEPAPDSLQAAFEEFGELPDIADTFYFVGPDGVVYRRNEFTLEGPVSARYRALDELIRQASASDAPPRDPWDIFWEGLSASGPGVLVGSIRNPWGRRGKPETREQLRAMHEQLEDLGFTVESGGKLKEKQFPGFGKGTWGGSGNTGSFYGDLVASNRGGRRTIFETVNTDSKGKITGRDWLKLFYKHLRSGDSVVGVPKRPDRRKHRPIDEESDE